MSQGISETPDCCSGLRLKNDAEMITWQEASMDPRETVEMS